jgi:outer membrane protein assembly factor BamB
LPLLALLALLSTACGRVSAPEGWSGPYVQGDTLYMTPQRGKFAAYRLDAQRTQRERLWLFPEKDERSPVVVKDGENLSAPSSDKVNFEGFYGNPVVTSDGVYLTAYAGYVVVLGTDGRPRWAAQLPDRLIGGALVTDDTVYAGTTGGAVFALARDSGRVRWRAAVSDQVWSTPIQAGDLIVVPVMDGALTAFNRDGAFQWSRSVALRGVASTPLLAGDRLYISSFDRRLYAVDLRTGEVLWRTGEADNWFWTEILPAGDTLYAGSLDGTVYAVDAGTGAYRWSVTVGNMVRGRAALADNVLVVGTQDGRLHGLQPASGARVWEVSKSPAPEDPTVPRGTLYADLFELDDDVLAARLGGDNGHVYILDVAQRRVREVMPR